MWVVGSTGEKYVTPIERETLAYRYIVISKLKPGLWVGLRGVRLVRSLGLAGIYETYYAAVKDTDCA